MNSTVMRQRFRVVSPDALPSALAFGTIVIGAGLTGMVFATTLARTSAGGNRVLLLEQGPASTLAASPEQRSMFSSEQLIQFAPGSLPIMFAPATVGGGSSVWSGWCPRPSALETAAWPTEVLSDLDDCLQQLEGDFQVSPSKSSATAWLMGTLGAAASQSAIRHVRSPATEAVQSASLSRSSRAMKAVTATDYVECHLVREYAQVDDAQCALCIMPGAQVASISPSADGVLHLNVRTPGQIRRFRVETWQNLVLAAGCLDSVRLAMGAGLCSDAQRTRMLRARGLIEEVLAVPTGPGDQCESSSTGHVIVRCIAHGRPFHIQVSASRCERPYFEVALAAIGDLEPTSPLPVRVRRSNDGQDCAVVDFQPSALSKHLLKAMRESLSDCAAVFGTQLSEDKAAGNRRLSVQLVQANGAMCIGESSTSPSDLYGRLRQTRNVYAAGLSLFPGGGSHNGGLVAAALAVRTATMLAHNGAYK